MSPPIQFLNELLRQKPEQNKSRKLIIGNESLNKKETSTTSINRLTELETF